MAPQVPARWSLALLVLLVVAAASAHDAGRAQDQERREFSITARRFEYSQPRIEVVQGDIVKITLTAEDIPHSFTLDDPYRIAKRAAPGSPVTFEFRAGRAGSFPFYCNLTIDDGCRQMRGEFVVIARRP